MFIQKDHQLCLFDFICTCFLIGCSNISSYLPVIVSSCDHQYRLAEIILLAVSCLCMGCLRSPLVGPRMTVVRPTINKTKLIKQHILPPIVISKSVHWAFFSAASICLSKRFFTQALIRPDWKLLFYSYGCCCSRGPPKRAKNDRRKNSICCSTGQLKEPNLHLHGTAAPSCGTAPC